MIYNNIHIYFLWLPFGQGIVINSKRVLVKLVKDPTRTKVHLDSTCQVIQHELNHAEKIKEKGWIDFMATTLWQYIFKNHDTAAYEPEAIKAESPIDQALKYTLRMYCINNNLEFY